MRNLKKRSILGILKKNVWRSILREKKKSLPLGAVIYKKKEEFHVIITI
jgi:hypothetical protein